MFGKRGSAGGRGGSEEIDSREECITLGWTLQQKRAATRLVDHPQGWGREICARSAVAISLRITASD